MQRGLAILGMILVVVAALLWWPDPSDPEVPPVDEEVVHEAPPDLAEADLPAPSSAGAEAGRSAADAIEERVPVGSENASGAEGTPFATVQVRLFGENDMPLAGAHAGVVPLPGGDLQLENLQGLYLTMYGRAPDGFKVLEVETDASGLAVVPLMAARENQEAWVLYGRAPGRLLAYRMVPTLKQGDTHDEGILHLNVGGALEVVVGDETGAAVIDAVVVLVSESGTSDDELPIHFQRTDANGRVFFESLGYGNYKIEVALEGYLTFHEEGLELVPGGVTYFEALLDRGGELQGEVVDHRGRGVGGIDLELQARNNRLRPEGLTQMFLGNDAWQTSAADGSFAGRGLVAEESYQLRAEPYPGITLRSDWVTAGEFVTLVIPPVAQVRGVVLDHEGEPAAEALLVYLEFDPAATRYGDRRSVTTASDGSYEILVPVGSYHLVAWHPSGEWIHPETIKIEDDQDFDLELPRGATLVLKAHDPAGQPTKDLEVQGLVAGERLRIPENYGRTMRELARLRKPRWQGKEMVIEGLTPGAVSLRTRSKAYLPQQVQLGLAAGARVERNLAMEPTSSLRIFLLSAEGGALRGRTARLLADGFEALGETGPKRSDRRGRVDFKGLRAGSYKLQYGTSNPQSRGVIWHDLQRVAVKPGAQELRLTLDE